MELELANLLDKEINMLQVVVQVILLMELMVLLMVPEPLLVVMVLVVIHLAVVVDIKVQDLPLLSLEAME